MATSKMKFKPAAFVLLMSCVFLLFLGGCARYARNVNTFSDTSAAVRGSGAEVYIVIPEDRQSHSADIKWVLGKVKDDDNNTIDEVFSPRSPAEIVQAAFARDLKRAGYAVVLTAKHPAGEQRVIDLTRTEIDLEQISDLVDLKATCRVLVGMDVYKDGQQIKRFQYESTASSTDIRERDMLARNVLEDALQAVVLKALPDLQALFNRQ